MPARSKITLLPPEIKKELDKRLIEGSFSHYEEMVKWLNERLAASGIDLTFGTSGLHRYGQGLERAQKTLRNSTEMAIALTDYAGDDAGKTNDMVMRLYVDKLFHVLLEMEDLDPENIDFAKLGRAISQVTRASVNQKKWMAEARKKAMEDAVVVVDEMAKQQGMNEDQARFWREKVLMGA